MGADSADRIGQARARAARAARAVSQQIGEAAGSPGWDFRVAVVTATSPLTIQYADGVPIAHVGRLAHYSPTILDTVLVLTRAPVATIIGQIV